MNKNLNVKLRDFRVKRIKKWLKLPKHRRRQTCPFKGLNHYNSCGICDKVLPDMNPSPLSKICPCNAYGLDSVDRLAKELIRRNTK